MAQSFCQTHSHSLPTLAMDCFTVLVLAIAIPHFRAVSFNTAARRSLAAKFDVPELEFGHEAFLVYRRQNRHSCLEQNRPLSTSKHI